MRRLACLLWVLVALAGCVSVPVSGPVEHHAPQQQQANPGVEIAPVPPAPGASPSLIVEGFLHAMATYQRDYAVARQFLTAPANQAWRPESGVQVYAEGYPPTVTDNSAVIAAPLAGSLDPQGVFTPGGTTFHHDFGLVRDDQGQWRISHPPDGLLISEYLFTSTFVRTELCFWDPGYNALVPDPRYFPKGPRQLTAAVGAVLAGPSAWLAPAVREPAAEDQAADSVALGTTGVVTVQLHQPEPPGQETRSRLLAELMWSLRAVDGVTGLRVRSGTTTWVRGSSDMVTLADFADRGPVRTDQSDRLFALARHTVNRVSDASAGAELVATAPALTKVTSFAVRHDTAQFAAVTDNRTKLKTAGEDGGPAKVELTSAGLERPQYSRSGELWVASDRTDRPPLAVIAEGKAVPVVASALPQGSVRAFRLSADGVRIAIVLEDRAGSRLGLARIVRSEGAIRVESWRDISPTDASTDPLQLLDVAWSDSSTLLALVSNQQLTRVLSLDTEGVAATDIGPGDATTLTQLTVNPGTPAMALSRDGSALRLYGEFTWGLVLNNVQGLAFPD